MNLTSYRPNDSMSFSDMVFSRFTSHVSLNVPSALLFPLTLLEILLNIYHTKV